MRKNAVSTGCRAVPPMAALLIACQGVMAQVTITPLLVRDDPALPGTTFAGLVSLPMISAEGGAVIFRAALAGDPNPASADTLWRLREPGSLELVARVGGPVPGLPDDAVFRTWITVAVGAHGAIALRAFARTPCSFPSGLWAAGENAPLELIASTSTPVPGQPENTVFVGFSSPVAAGSAAHPGVAFLSTDRAPNAPFYQSVWRRPAGTGPLPIQLVARQESPAPGAPDGARFSSFGQPLLSPAGHLAFTAATSGVFGYGIWMLEPQSDLRAVVYSGDPAPGLPDGTTYWYFSTPSLNAAGQLAFVASVKPAPPELASAVFGPGPSGLLTAIARTGTAPPGAGPNDRFFSLGMPTSLSGESQVALNAAGQVAFLAEVRGTPPDYPPRYGVWATDEHHQLIIIAMVGQPAPGTPPGTRFDFSFDFPWARPHIGDHALVVFKATAGARLGIWGYRSDLGLFKIAYVGDQIEIRPGETRTIQWLDMVPEAAGADGRATALAGSRLVFRASFGTTFGYFCAETSPP